MAIVRKLVIGGSLKRGDWPWIELEADNEFCVRAREMGLNPDDVLSGTENKMALMRDVLGYPSLMDEGGERPIEECRAHVIGGAFRRFYYDAKRKLGEAA